jgi:microcystin-dependent protein
MKPYAVETADAAMAQTSISTVGGNQPHSNLQPYLCVNFIISLFGIFPSPT